MSLDTAAQQALADQMQARLRERLGSPDVTVVDESAAHAGHAGANGTGFGTHFRVRAASPRFAGLGRVACHRLVYDALHDFIAQGVHAVAIEVRSLPATRSD
jgi:BolA family transcriptional regulator, general stress-responsive regulator